MNSPAPSGRVGGAIALLILGIGGVSTASLWARGSDSTGVELAFRRLILTVPILWFLPRLFSRKKKGARNIRWRLGTELPAILVSGVSLALHFAAYFISLLRLDSVAVTLVFVSLHPVLLLPIEAWRTRRAPSLGVVGGVFLALAGCLVLALEEGGRDGGDLWGIGWGVISAAAMVTYLLAGRRATQALPATVYAARSYLVAAITLAVGIVVLDGTVILDGTLLPPNANEWRIALFLAIFPTVLGHTPLNAALRILPASVVSTAFLGEIVGASLLVWIVLAEVPPPGFAWGGPAIVGGILAVIWGSDRRRRKERA